MALAATAPGAGASLVTVGAPAAADAAATSRDVSFTYQGTPVTCTVEGFSEFNYSAELEQTNIAYRTKLTDPDPLCAEAISLTSATVTYRRSDGTEELASASGTEMAEGHLIARGEPVVDVAADHRANFRCDEVSPRTYCMLSFSTSPKWEHRGGSLEQIPSDSLELATREAREHSRR